MKEELKGKAGKSRAPKLFGLPFHHQGGRAVLAKEGIGFPDWKNEKSGGNFF